MNDMAFMNTVIVIIILLYVVAAGYFVSGLSRGLVDWLVDRTPSASRRRTVSNLQDNWTNFRLCRLHSCSGMEYWDEWMFDYERIRSLSGWYLCTGE